MGVAVDLAGADAVGVESSDGGWFVVVHLAQGGDRRYGPFDLERALKGMRRLNRVLMRQEKEHGKGTHRSSGG